MNVSIKQFDVEMKIKNKGIEIDVCDPGGQHVGDLVITKTNLTWCRGRTLPNNGKRISWGKFIEYMEGAATAGMKSTASRRKKDTQADFNRP